jgi:hypothetical protein
MCSNSPTQTNEDVEMEIAADGWVTDRYITLSAWKRRQEYLRNRTTQDIEDEAQRGWF